MIYSTERLTITIPITQTARRTAQAFARDQPTLEKSKRVYLNTLAVLVVQNYMQMLDISTNLESSHSWNSVGRMFADVADLNTDFGRLECRPITNEQTCFVPPEVWQDRIGYIVVQVDETCREGTLLGFVPTVSQQHLPINQLRSLDELLVHLHQPTSKLVRLSQWFDDIIEPGWQTMEELLGTRSRNPLLAFRTGEVGSIKNPENLRRLIKQLYASQTKTSAATIPPDPSAALTQLLQTTQDEETRWTAAELLWTTDPGNSASGVRRVIDLGMQLAGHAVALMVAILPKPDQKIAVLLRVYPMGNQSYLPPGLQLVGLDEAGNSFLTAQSREKDDYNQLKFSADPGERFSVRVVLDNASITENFVV